MSLIDLQEHLSDLSFIACGKHPLWADYMPHVGDSVPILQKGKSFLFECIDLSVSLKEQHGLQQELNFNRFFYRRILWKT